METFRELIDSPKLVLVHFSATWCTPCEAMSSVLAKIDEKQNEEIRIVNIDIDKNIDTAVKYSVQSLPTLMLFKEGKQLWRQIGLIDTDELNRIIEMLK